MVSQAVLAGDLIYVLRAIAADLCTDLGLSVTKLGAVVSLDLEPRHPDVILVIINHKFPLLLMRSQGDFWRRYLGSLVFRLSRLSIVDYCFCDRILLQA